MPFIDADPSQFLILGHVALAMGLGAIIGAERQAARKAAGLRTHMLVAAGAALLVGLGEVVVKVFESDIRPERLGADPIRIVHGVITGIGFLGAGSIIARRDAERPEGVTTAASIWFVAAIGICVALSQIPLAIGSTVLAYVPLHVVKRFES